MITRSIRTSSPSIHVPSFHTMIQFKLLQFMHHAHSAIRLTTSSTSYSTVRSLLIARHAACTMARNRPHAQSLSRRLSFIPFSTHTFIHTMIRRCDHQPLTTIDQHHPPAMHHASGQPPAPRQPSHNTTYHRHILRWRCKDAKNPALQPSLLMHCMQ